jgi:hypothetical protein
MYRFFLMITFLNGLMLNYPQKVQNYYGIDESLKLDGIDFKLRWSSHPNNAYYKQEYIPKNESTDQFEHMLFIDLIKNDIPIENVVTDQIANLKLKKVNDPVVNYQLLSNKTTREFVLDFVVSDMHDGEINQVEWNVYHYRPYIDKLGNKGVLLIAACRRAYGKNVNPFLKSLAQIRGPLIKKVAEFQTPEMFVR